jgi:hypothetical protein
MGTLPESRDPGRFETRHLYENGGIRRNRSWLTVTTTLPREWWISKRLATDSGTYTSAGYDWVGWTRGGCASRIHVLD